MVYPLGLGPVALAAYEAQIATHHRMRVRIELRDLDHDFVASLTGSRLDGSVQVQADSEGATRSCSLSLFDPTDQLGLGTGGSGVTPNRMLQIWRGAFVEDLNKWVDVPVFCGPISKPSRDGDTLSLEAQDKASMADSYAQPMTVKKGTNMMTAVRQVMTRACGETRFRLSSTSRKLSKDLNVSRDQNPWQLVRRICRALGWVCFYDGGGYLVCRPKSSTTAFTFRAGVGGTLTSGVQTGYWDNEIRNQAIVLGATVSKTVIKAVATIGAGNPFSPESLKRGGVRRFIPEIVEDSSISTFSEAMEVAQRTVLQLAAQQTTADFESLPVPHLQEHDIFAVVDPLTGQSTKARLAETTIPLTVDGMQSVGRTSRSKRSRIPVRRRPKSARLKRAERNAAKARAAAKRKAALAAKKKRLAASKKAAAAAKKRRSR